jgi:diacylglycerol kinase family enzyme
MISDVPLSGAACDAVAPLFIILNAKSGHNDTATTQKIIEDVLAQAGRKYYITVVDDPAQLREIARRSVEQAQACGGVIVVAGGDGAINTVAQAVLGSGCPFGVLPQGTFNYFCRTHGIPEDTEQATRILLSARAHPVQVGLINDRVFLVSASLGLYRKLIENREAYKKQFGRTRLVAFVSAILTVIGRYRVLKISLEQDGEPHAYRTPSLFVGNNPLQLEQIGIPLASRLAGGQLVAIMLRPVSTLAMLWLLIRGAFGKLGAAENVISFSFNRLKARQATLYRKRVKVATDGEIVWLKAPLEFRVSPQPLYLLKPDDPIV